MFLREIQRSVGRLCDRLADAIEDGADMNMSGEFDISDIPQLEELGWDGKIRFKLTARAETKGRHYDRQGSGDGDRDGS